MSKENEANKVHHEEYLFFTQVPSPRLSDGDEENETHEEGPASFVPAVPPSSTGTVDVDLKPENHKNTESDVEIEKDISSIGIWKVNGDDDSSSQSSVSSSLDPILEMPMTLTERRAFNIQRNNALLKRLGMMNNNYTSPFKSVAHWKDEVADLANSPEPTTEPCRGMIIPTCWANMERQQRQSSPKPLSSSLKELYDRYPHRSAQIRKLFSLLSVTTMTTTKASIAPPPIFVIGPAGSGKTMIVRDVVQLCCCMDYDSFPSTTVSTVSEVPELPTDSTKQHQMILSAYIDCATLDSFNMEEFFSSAFSQWRRQMVTVTTAEPARNQHPRTSQPSTDKVATTNSTIQQKDHQPQVNYQKIQRKRRAKLGPRKTSSNLDTHVLNFKSSTDPASPGQMHGIQNITLTAVWTFGRSLQYMLDQMKRERLSLVSVVLIVDHAELLLSLGTSHSKTLAGDRINVLAQLLMLPQAFGINLNIIAISKNGLLEHTGTLLQTYQLQFLCVVTPESNRFFPALNNMKSQGTLGIHICPITIYFPAYRGKAVIQAVRGMPSISGVLVARILG
jgi:Cdc6-like AAA superfamily ATPase